MTTLMQQEKTLWPQVGIVSSVDLVEEDLDKGPWAMAYSPVQYCKAHNLLEITPEGFGKQLKFNMKINKTKATKCFANQLGRPWRGVEHMAPHRKALFAVFAGRGCRDSSAATQIIENLNRSIGSGTEANYDGVDALIKKHYNSRDVQDICKSHAYETTIITSMLLFARQDGVLATSEILWLKPLDRRFWYTINNVGRQTPCIEVAGIHGHWLAEKALGRSLSVPYLTESIKGLEIAISEIIYEPNHEERDKLLAAREKKK